MRYLSILKAVLACLALSGGGLHAQAAAPRQHSDIGRAEMVGGFSVTVRWIVRAPEAGLSDYVAARGNVFELIDVVVQRKGSHESLLVDPADFRVQTSRGVLIDSEQFGIPHELVARHIYSHIVEGVIGFEVPARDAGLQLLWQPNLTTSPDAQGAWMLGRAGRQVRYYQ